MSWRREARSSSSNIDSHERSGARPRCPGVSSAGVALDLRVVAQSELSQYPPCDSTRWLIDVHADVLFVLSGLLEVRQLAVQEARWHEMPSTRRQPCRNRRAGTHQIYE